MASLSLRHIFKVYDDSTKAVNDFNMEIRDNEFIVFVGPSGCGKSTTLRMIAGLEEISSGELRIDGELVNDYEPKDRNIAMVFQNYALYPHMTVYENMAFSLRTLHTPKDEIHKKVMEAARILGIESYLERKPKALSGGQRQRVALGRAIVRSPKVFLLDEPLSNLDAKLRAAMRAEISRLHEQLKTTFIYVTHDQVEAMTMGTRIVVMKDGFVQQIDTPINLYDYPDNIFVAGFIGTPQMNFFEGVANADKDNVTFSLDCGCDITMPKSFAAKVPHKYMDGKRKIVFGVRYGGIRLFDKDAVDNDMWSHAKAVVSVVEMLGDETLVYANLNLDTPDEKPGTVIIKAPSDCKARRGDIIDISVTRKKFYLFDKETEESINRRVPLENCVPCNIKDNKLLFCGSEFSLPPAIEAADTEDAELTMPIHAILLGEGGGKAKIEQIDDVENKCLYMLRCGELLLFCLDEKGRFSVGDEALFDIDMRYITIDKCGIKPPVLENFVGARFIKEKNKEGGYSFLWETEMGRFSADAELSKKLFAIKGRRIFSTPMQLTFSADGKSVSLSAEDTSLPRGKITKIYDYGNKKYAEICIYSARLIAEYDDTVQPPVNVGSDIYVSVDQSKMSVKDTSVDIIII